MISYAFNQKRILNINQNKFLFISAVGIILTYLTFEHAFFQTEDATQYRQPEAVKAVIRTDVWQCITVEWIRNTGRNV